MLIVAYDDSTKDLFRKLSCARALNQPEVAFYKYKHVRYTFISSLFQANKMDMEGGFGENKNMTCGEYLKELHSSFIWNVYKILTHDYLGSYQEVPFKERL